MSADPRTCIHFNHGAGPQCSLKNERGCNQVCADYQPDFEYMAEKREEQKREDAMNGEGCFLTSACVDALGKEDDCYELETLRRFRDEWLASQDGGSQDIANYYSFAPSVVANIDRLPNRLNIYMKIYEELVSPCVKLIEEGRMQETWELYKGYAQNLIETYGVAAA